MVDQEKIREAVRLLLEGIGEDVAREGLAETPDRIARMYEELFSGMGTDAREPLSRVFPVGSKVLFHVRASHDALLRQGAHRLYTGRQGGGLKQACQDGGGVRQEAADPGAHDRADCGRADEISCAPGGNGGAGGGAYVHDHAGREEARRKTVSVAARGVFKDNPLLQEHFFAMLRLQD